MLEMSLWLMLVEAGIFLVTLVLLNMWLFKPLVEFMEKRDAKLKADKDSISANEKDTQKYEEEILSILEASKIEANKIRKSAYEEAKAESKKQLDAKIIEIEKSKVDFVNSLESVKTELKDSLSAKLPLIKDKLSDRMKDIA